MPTAPLKGKIFQEPVLDLTFPGLGKTATFKLKTGVKINNFITTLTVTGSAAGAGVKTAPRPSWGLGDMRLLLGNYNRTRKASELFGMNGLQARNSIRTGGTVQYSQGGVLITVLFQGRLIGGVPVLIDGYEDLALQAALIANTATVAVFFLPWMFAEYFRADPMWGGTSNGLATGFSDGTILGTPYVELDIPAASGVAGTMTAVNLSGSLSYTEEVAVAGSTVNMCKQKVHLETYAAGDVELAKNFQTKDILQRFSVMCVTDTISKIVVKHGDRVVRQVTFGENHVADLAAEIEGGGTIPNRFDIDLDQDDDPTRSVKLNSVDKLSIVATFVTAADVPASCRLLADYWGPVEN